MQAMDEQELKVGHGYKDDCIGTRYKGVITPTHYSLATIICLCCAAFKLLVGISVLEIAGLQALTRKKLVHILHETFST